jgi:hypothetical protein
MKSLILALVSGMLVSSHPSPTSGAGPKTMNPLHAVHVSDAAGLLIDGTLDVSQFVVNNGKIWAVCKLKGLVGGISIDHDCMVPVTVGDCDGGIRFTSELQRSAASPKIHDCECLTITFESCTITPTVTPTLILNSEEVPCTVQDFPGDALCCANRLIGTIGSSCFDICGCMNRLL